MHITKKLVERCTNISQTESVLQSELLFGALPSDVIGDVIVVFWANQNEF
jgi:hypothetical protein